LEKSVRPRRVSRSERAGSASTLAMVTVVTYQRRFDQRTLCILIFAKKTQQFGFLKPNKHTKFSTQAGAAT
jgi:hypothetical protein